MARIRLIAFALWALLACVVPTYAAAYNDDFNDGLLDPNSWVTEMYGVDGSIAERNQRLEVVIPQASLPVPNYGLTASIGCRSLFALRGDFDVQVEYALFGASHFDNGGIGLIAGDNGVWRYSSAAGLSVYGFVLEVPTTDTAGDVRLVRQGSLMTAYYRSAADWVSLGSSAFTTDDVRIELAYHNVVDGQIGSPVYLALDNFTVNADEIVNPVPEPSSVAVLTVGVLGVIVRLRRRR